MTTDNHDLLTQQHRDLEAGITGLVDGSGSRAEFAAAIDLLMRHIHVEEAFLFPVIERDEGRHMALARMRYDHGDMWPHLESAAALLAAKSDLEVLLPPAEALLRQLADHDRREEEAIYSAADRYVADANHPPLAELFTHNVMPVGWRCRYAPE